MIWVIYGLLLIIGILVGTILIQRSNIRWLAERLAETTQDAKHSETERRRLERVSWTDQH